MLLTVYRHILSASTPFLEHYLRKRQRMGKEDAARAGERRGRASSPRPDGFLVWAHAASVGESLSLLPVVEGMIREKPHIHILVTTGTVTSAKMMKDRLPSRVIHQYVPVDHPLWVERFLDHWRPDLALWTESEFWPNLLAGLKSRRVPAVLLNARLSVRSFRRWRKLKGFASSVLGAFTFCLAQNGAEAGRLRALGVSDVRVAGNLKYASRPLPYDAAAHAALGADMGRRPRVLWASTHEGEEAAALRLHKKLKTAYPDILSVVVPRHPVRGDAIAAELSKDGDVRLARRSAGEKPAADTDIYLADTLGELGLFFRLCPLVVMGGSFADKGGHNPIEPAQLGCTVFFGPSRHNFLTIFDEFLAANAMIPVDSEGDLAIAVENALAAPAAAALVGRAAEAWTADRAKVADDIIAAIRPLLPA